MSWQDIILALCILGFNIALIPTIFHRHKPHASTGLMTASFQMVAFVVYVSLALWYSAAMAALNAAMWLIVVVQKLNQGKNKRSPLKRLKGPVRSRQRV